MPRLASASSAICDRRAPRPGGVEAQCILDVTQRGHVLKERIVLKDYAHVALAWGGLRDVLAIEKHAAGIRMLETNEDAQEGRLSAAGGAQYREKLSPLHVESNSMEHFAAVKGLLDSFDGELMGVRLSLGF